MDRAEKPGTCKLMIHERGGFHALQVPRSVLTWASSGRPRGLWIGAGLRSGDGAFLVDVVAAGSRIQAPIRHVMIGEGPGGGGG